MIDLPAHDPGGVIKGLAGQRQRGRAVALAGDALWQCRTQGLAGFRSGVAGVAAQVPLNCRVYVWRHGRRLVADL